MVQRQSLTVYPTSHKERSLAFGIGFLLFLVSTVALLMSDQISMRFHPFLLIIFSISACAEWITAYLLYGEFMSTRKLGIFVLLITYISCGLLTGFHLLTVPGIFLDQAIWGLGMTTTSWLWTYSHILFPLGILAYLLSRNSKIPAAWSESRLNGLILAGVAGIVLAVSGLALLTIHFDPQLPTIWMKHEWDSSFVRVVAYLMAIFMLSLCIWLWFQRRSNKGILLWLGIAQFGGLLELAVTLFFNHSYTFGWYVARMDGLSSSIVVMCAMLFQFNRMQNIVNATQHSFQETEKMLRDSELRYHSFFQHNLDLMFSMDGDGWIMSANPAFSRITGYPNAELLKFRLVDLVASDSQPSVQRAYQRIMGGEPQHIEATLIGADGSRIELHLTAVPICSDDQITGVYGIGKDVTEQKRIEELLIRSEKLSVIGQLAAGVAHEIRNPLTAIKGFLQLMQAGDQGKQEYFEIMSEELNRIQTIVSELLVLAKPQYMKFEPKDIHQLLVYVVTLLQSQANLKNIQIQLVSEEDLIWVNCDENQLKQVFINFLKNAFEATEALQGAGEIKIQMERFSAEEVKISFIDNGCGIPEERLPHLGEPFYTTKEKGTGLGLMVSHKIVEAHGGRIEFHSKVNEGTQVIVYLPTATKPFA